MELVTAILWIHALAGAAWVAACVCFVVAGIAPTAGSEEQRSFALRAAPKISGFSIMAAVLVLITGGLNLGLAGVARRFQFSLQFGFVLAAKVVLFVAMAFTLGRITRIIASLRSSPEASDNVRVQVAMSDATRLHTLIALMGGIALLLGLWLMGS